MQTPGTAIPALQDWYRAAFRLDLRSLAVFRMLLGGIVCCDAMLRTRDFQIMFAADGLFPIDVLRAFQNDPSVWSLCYLSDSLTWQGFILATEGIAGLSLALGFFTRLACLVAWLATVSVVRRTAPAANAGDVWLASLLFWGLFLPLGSTWSVDARRAGRGERGTAWAVPLVLQIAAVYLAAGLSKWNSSWFTGEAVAYALSVHDHGTPLGEWLAGIPPLSSALSWSVLALEIVGPLLLLAVPVPAVRLAIVFAFIAFHTGVACLMTVGLFAPIGAAAWTAIIPGCFWDRVFGGRSAVADKLDRPCAAPWFQAFFAVVAAVIWIHTTGPWRSIRLPYFVVSVANLACLPQQWNMFGDVPGQRQWVYGRAELADGRTVDLLRGGRPMETRHAEKSLPDGGFFSLPHHRWHKLFWELPRPPMQVFSPAIASALARGWNATHGPNEQVLSLEIRFARLQSEGPSPTFHELLIASWPDRGSRGTGNLERFLEKSE